MNTENYEFGISGSVDLDILRIIRENKEKQIILVTSGENALMLLHLGLLQAFVPEDEVVICGEWLSTYWGYTRVEVFNDRGSTVRFDTFEVEGGKLEGWRARSMNTEDIEENVMKLKSALKKRPRRYKIEMNIALSKEALRKRPKRFKIKVNTLSEED